MIDIEWRFQALARKAFEWSFDAHFLHTDHHGTHEFVASLQSQELVLPIRFVEEDDIEIDRITIDNFSDFLEKGKVRLRDYSTKS